MNECVLGRSATRRSVVASLDALVLVALLLPLTSRADPEADCTDFQWDMSRELALFRSESTPVRAAARPEAMPRLEVGRVYAIEVLPQATVIFAQPPGAHRTVEDPHAGVLEFTVPANAHYRVSADGPVWIDVVAGGRVISSSSYNGHAHCSLVHKSVDLELPAQTVLTLQLSQSPARQVRLAITAAPAPSPAAPARP